MVTTIVFFLGVTVAALYLHMKGQFQKLDQQLRQIQTEIGRLTSRLSKLEAQADRRSSPAESTLEDGAIPGPEVPVAPPPAPEPPRPDPSGPSEDQPPPPREQPPTPAGEAPTGAGLETLIGGNWLLKIGILAIVVGAVYFLKYAFDNQWIGDRGRVLIGVFAGLSLVYAGELFQKKNYLLYGQTLAAGGISILYLSVYAAFNFYSLIPQLAAFLFMILITAMCGVQAARLDSKVLAMLGLLGGLLTPFWLSTGESNQVSLLGYVLILDLGMGVLAASRGWFFLNGISFPGTVILFFSWGVQFYSRDDLWTTQAFLVVFAGLYCYLIYQARHQLQQGGDDSGAKNHQFNLMVFASSVIVLFFAGTQANLSDDASYYWTFLVLFNGLLLGIGLSHSPTAPRANLAPGLFWLSASGIVLWIATFYRQESLLTTWIGSTVVFALFLVQPLFRRSEAARSSQVSALLALGLGYFGLSYFLLAEELPEWMGLYAVVLGVVFVGVAHALVRQRPEAAIISLAYVGVALTLATLAIPIEFDQDWVVVGWAAESVILIGLGFRAAIMKLRVSGLLVLLLSLAAFFDWGMWLRGSASHWVSYLSLIGAFYAGAFLYRKAQRQQGWEKRVFTTLLMIAGVITVVMLAHESWAYYGRQLRELSLSLQREVVTGSEHAELVAGLRNARQVTLSVLWGFYSIAVVMIGIWRRFRPVRLFGIALFFVTIGKVFLIDIWTLTQLYRILSVLSLGLLLLAVAFFYQRFMRRIIGE